VANTGTVFVADSLNSTIRSMTQAGVVTTLAGSALSCGNVNAAGTAARFCHPNQIAVDAAGTIYVADTTAATIRTVTPTGVVGTLAGAFFITGGVDGIGGAARFNGPVGIAVDTGGTAVYVADGNNSAIRRITAGAVVTTFAGVLNTGALDGTGAAARFNYPGGIAVDGAGTVYVADRANSTIRTITTSGVVGTLAGTAGSCGYVNDTGAAARFCAPEDIAVDGAGTLYVADRNNNAIRLVHPGGAVTTYVGGGGSGSADGIGPAARFSGPENLAVDGAGTVYVADTQNHTIRKVAPGGVVTTLAGLAGSSGSSNGVGSAARFSFPHGVAVDGAGTVYVSDNNDMIRAITPGGVVSTLAGADGVCGSADGTGSAARFCNPQGMAIDAAGVIYVADANHTIRTISPGGIVRTVAGLFGRCGSADGTGSAARFCIPRAVAVGPSGTLFVSDQNNHTIRRSISDPAPGPPTGLAVTAMVGNMVTIGWAPPAGGIEPSGYVLEGGTNPGEVLASIPTLGTAPSFTFPAPTGAFYIRMHAVTGQLRSAASNEIRIFVSVPVPPSAPANLLGLVNGSAVALSWTNSFSGGAPTSLLLNVTGALTASLPLPLGEGFSFVGVPAGTYTVSLTAVNATGLSPPSNAVTLTFPGGCTGAPEAPTNFVATKSGSTISVSWRAPASGAAVSGYTLVVTGSFVGSIATTGRSLAGSVVPGSYTLSVMATNACGQSPATASQTLTIP
jgi:sugar lactone lactonase YvrE